MPGTSANPSACSSFCQVGQADKNGQCALLHGALKGHTEIIGILLGQDWGPENAADPPQHQTTTGKKQAVQQAVTAAASVGHTQVHHTDDKLFYYLFIKLNFPN